MPTFGKYLRLSYGNSCDFDGIHFSDGEIFDMYIDGILSHPIIEHEESKTENSDNESDFTKRVMTIKYMLIFTGDQWVKELINFIRLCDYKMLTDRAGDVYAIEDMIIEGETEQGAGRFECLITARRIIWEKCCDNMTELDCDNYQYTAQDVISTGSPLYTNPQSVGIGTYYVAFDGSNYILVQRAVNGTELGYWNKIGVASNHIIKTLAELYGYKVRYMRDQNALPGSYDLVQCPYLEAMTPESTNQRFTGQAPEGYMVQVYTSADDITYTAVAGTHTAEEYTQDGIVKATALLSNYNYIALLVRGTGTICSVSNMLEIPS